MGLLVPKTSMLSQSPESGSKRTFVPSIVRPRRFELLMQVSVCGALYAAPPRGRKGQTKDKITSLRVC